MKLIRDYRQIQEKDTTGITVNKHNIEDNLINAMIKVISGLIAHATVTENPELLQSINYTHSNLIRSRTTYFMIKRNSFSILQAPSLQNWQPTS